MNKYIFLTFILSSFSMNSLATSADGHVPRPCTFEGDEDLQYFKAWNQKFNKETLTLKTCEEDLATKKKTYCTGDTNYYKIAKTVATELFKTAISTGTSVVAGRFFSPAQPDGGVPVAPGLNPSTMLMASALTTAISSSVGNVFTAIKESALTLDEGLGAVHQELKKESEARVANFSEDRKKQLEILDATISQNILSKQGETALKCLNRRQALISMPSKTINVAQYDKDGDPRLARAIDRNVEELLARYPSNIQEPLSLLIQSIRDNSIAEQGSQIQAFLFGPTGTGKTTFVQRLGEALGLHVCVINLSKIEPEELLGWTYPDPGCEKKNDEVMGKIGSCFIEAGLLNPLIFFDEAGEYLGESTASHGYDLNLVKKQMIQAQFKKVLDPNSKSLKFQGMGVSQDTSRATILFASNYEMTDPALLSRMPQIHFSRLTRAEKEVAAQVGFDQALKSLAHFMPENEIRAIKDVAQDYLPFVLDEDDKRNPGARIVQEVIKELVGRIRLLKIKEEKTKQLHITREALEAFVQKSFERRERITQPNQAPAAQPQTEAVTQEQPVLVQ